MAKSTLVILSIVIGSALILNPCRILGADKPEIEIVLEFTKNVYTYGDPIGATVKVIHHPGKDLISVKDLFLSRGFRAMDFFMEMRIIDPAKRLVLVRHHKTHNEFPDAPPLPFILYKKEPARAIQCEAFRPNSRWEVTNEDIRDHYALELPGEYSAQIQISVATFKGEPCNTKNYRWLGVLKSNTDHFTIEPAENKKQSARRPDPLPKFSKKENTTVVTKSHQPACSGVSLRIPDPFRQPVGTAEISYLARCDKFIHPADYFFNTYFCIVAVQIIKIDIISSQRL